MMINRPDRCDLFWKELEECRRMIRDGRELKGNQEKFEEGYICFKTALDNLWNLNSNMPTSPFSTNYFTLVVGLGSAILGAILGFLLALLIKR